MLPTQVSDRLRKSVVLIKTLNGPDVGFGTGSIVKFKDQPYLMTCNHVIPSKNVAENALVYFDREDDVKRPGIAVKGRQLFHLETVGGFQTDHSSESSIDVTLIAIRRAEMPHTDILLVRLLEPKLTPKAGDGVVIWFYLNSGSSGFSQSLSTGIVQGVSGHLFTYNAEAAPGAGPSGAPVFKIVNGDAVIVGLHRGSVESPPHVSSPGSLKGATHIHAIVSFLAHTPHGLGDMDPEKLLGISSGEDKMDEPLPSRVERMHSPLGDENPSSERGKSNIDLLLPDDSSPPPPSLPTWTEQYKKAIEQRDSVTLHITRCVLIGPPRVGKSSLKLLLINNEPPDKEVEKSTDLMEAPVVLTSLQCQDKKGSQWKELTTNSLQQLVIKSTREARYDPGKPSPIQSSHASQLTSEGSTSHISTAVASDTDVSRTTVADSLNTSPHLVDYELKVRYHDFVTKLSGESLAELKLNGLKMVHVFDCGGQLAFQDTIPLLINAPCAFISVFNASIDLDEEVEQKYCTEKGVELSLGYKESQWNMLHRIFSSIHSLQFKCHDDILHLIKDTEVVPSSPMAVVGTHKDVLQEASKKDGGLRQSSTIKKIKDRLDQLRDSKLFDFLREGCTHDLVTNLSKDDLSAIESLRKDITESKATLSLELPISWIILELFTRSLERKYIRFHDLQQLCFHNDIVKRKEEFSSLLQVLHVLGFYAFYQLDGVPEDQNWVCTDAATLYREVTKMLVVQYKKNIKKGATIKFQRYGRIRLNKATLQDVFTDLEINIGGVDPMWFIRVLLHIGLAAKFKREGLEEVFIPLALPFKRSDVPSVTSVATVCFTLEFPREANESRMHANIVEIPRGIFPRLIVYLLSQQRSEEFQWLVDTGDSRSQIKLIHDSYKFVIYLCDHVDHIKLDLVLSDTFSPTLDNVVRTTKVGHLCQELRKHLESALDDTFYLVFGDQPPKRKPTVVCGFKCSSFRHDSSHMAIVQPADEPNTQDPLYTEKCVHGTNLKYVEKPDQLIWFSPVKETTFARIATGDGHVQGMIWVMKGTDALESDLHQSDDSSPPPTWTVQYKKAIEQQVSVTLHITRCVLIGPPRVGKSSLKLLLINNEPPDKEAVKKSTDLMEAPVVLTSIREGSQWKELTQNNLQQLVNKCTREEDYNSAQPNPIQSSYTTPQLTPDGSHTSHISTAVAPDTDNVSTTAAESSKTSMQEVRHRNTKISEDAQLKMNGVSLEAKYNVFIKEIMSEESLTNLEMNGLKMVHVFDCGGQLAFQDTIPLLINAPCAFISVFNASIDLDKEVELKYCPKKGKELCLGHKESQWHMLRRIFSSIHSLQFKCHDDITHLIKDKTVVPSSPIAVVGTHKDVLQEDSKRDGGLMQRTEEKIKKRLEELRESKPYEFVREKDCTLDLVANLSKDDLSAIECLRNDITESKATLPLQLPLSWIILELFTRSLEIKYIRFHDLQHLCFRNRTVTKRKEDFSSLLHVLHILGFYAFYQLNGVPEDQNWVCTDAATLYSEVTKILVVQYKKPQNLKKLNGATIELQRYGRLKLNKPTLQHVFADLEVNINGADPMWFIRVLLHIGLAAEIEDEGQKEAFIPLALPFKHSDLPPVTSVATICFTLEFPSGTRKSRVCANVTEIPRGIFPRLIVYLLSQQRSGEFQWQVDKGDSRSRIKLRHQSEKYVIYLSEHVDHIELDLVLNDTFFLPTQHYSEHNTRVRKLCDGLREHLKSALDDTFVSVFGKQPPERRPSVVCGLKCSSCHDSFHMAIVRPADESTPQDPLYTEKCVRGVSNRQFVEKPQLIWFSPNKETTPPFERKTFRTKDGQSKIWVMKGTLESDLANRPSAKDLQDISHKTGKNSKDLLRSLEIEEARIATFVMDNPNDSAEACYQGLMLWENENALLPVTWGTLKAALKKAQLTKLANELPPKEK